MRHEVMLTATTTAVCCSSERNMAAASDAKGVLNRFLKRILNIHPTLKTSSDFVFEAFTKAIQKYEQIVINEPEKVAKLESMLSFFSFALPGQFRSSELLSELLYFATRMLSLLHDVIRRRRFSSIYEFLWTQKSYIEMTLTVVEYTEVFVELGAVKLWGEAGKWIVILLMQIFKAALKIILLFYFDSGIQTSPSLQTIRDKVNFEKTEQMKTPENFQSESLVDDELHHAWKEANRELDVTKHAKSGVWAGKRSGRVIRSLNNAPPNGFRDWRVPLKSAERNNHHDANYYKLKSKLSNDERIAELAYILKPLAHMLCMFFCGEASWKPWLLSIAIDVSSLHCLGTSARMYDMEKDEILRRKASFLMYLLRSPFYDNYSKHYIFRILTALKDKIPVLGAFSRPLLEYLPVWQKFYSHTWSN